jgi:beta-xylosidase
MLKPILFSILTLLFTSAFAQKFVDVSDIHVRDPFILVNAKDTTYYLYAQMQNRLQMTEERGVDVYRSKDLKNWEGPFPVLSIPENFLKTQAVWAPEVHLYQDKYYMFVTLTAYDTIGKHLPGKPLMYKRGTHIFYSDSPKGPFKPFDNKPFINESTMTLDGTLWVENGIPYMFYCHEWVQITDGTMDLVALKKDLSSIAGASSVLFKATDAKWVKSPNPSSPGYITDGPFVYKTKQGCLLMIWSSFGEEGYALGLVKSMSGSIKGPWKQSPERLFKKDGGHGMIFKTFDNRILLILHQPNYDSKERIHFFEVEEDGCDLVLKENPKK